MKVLNFIIAFFFLISISSCSKEGAEGPLGPKGAQGAQGIPGTDGNMLRYDNGPPAITDGGINDFYIDKLTANLYGPKTATGWGNPFPLKGETGDTGSKGQDGSQFLSDTGVPTTQGKVGDFYFQPSTTTLYGPKTSAGWGTGIRLKGPQGDKGEDGRTILSGTSNPTGAVGDIGDFYINTSSYVIFGPKTAVSWGSGKSILGAKGDKGEAKYVILNGITDPTNAIGNFGDFYINRATKTLWFRYVQFLNTPAWGHIADLSNTIQFSKKIDIPGSLDPIRDFQIDFNLPWDILEKSMINVYVKNVSWYPLPGKIGNNRFTVAFSKINNGGQTRLTLLRESGSTYFRNVDLRIVVTEAEEFRVMSNSIDIKNYNDVQQYFKLQN